MGEVRTYRAELSSTSSLSLGSAYPQVQASEQAVSTRMRGSLRLDIFEAQGESALARVVLAPEFFSLNAGGQDVPGGLEQLRNLAQVPLIARLHRDGRVLGVRASAMHEQQPLLLGPLKTLLAVLQAIQPPQPGTVRWDGEEDDTTGLSVVAYTRSGANLEKRKQSYRALATPAGLKPVDASLKVVPREALAQLSLEVSGWPESVTSTELVEIFQASPGPNGLPQPYRVATVTTRASLRLATHALTGALPPADADWRGQPERRLAHASEPPGGLEDHRPPQFLLDELRATESINDEAERLRAQSALLLPLSDAMRRMPLATRMASEALRSPKGISLDRASTLIGALMSAGTPEAQLELGRVAREPRVDERIRRQALGQLGLVEKPTAESVTLARESLSSADVDERATGSLALGSMTRSLRQAGDPLATDTTQVLLGLLREARTELDKVLALDALGNAGAPEALPTLLAALLAPEPMVRNSAVRALRQMPSGAADEAINRTLFKDPEPLVREGAVFALGFRELTRHLTAIRSALSVEPQPRVRLALVRLLGDRMREVPTARELLVQTASSDTDLDVRLAARDELSGRLVNKDGQWVQEPP